MFFTSYLTHIPPELDKVCPVNVNVRLVKGYLSVDGRSLLFFLHDANKATVNKKTITPVNWVLNNFFIGLNNFL
jgi:hypothetical protein